jgi:hypothetical protein
MREQRSTRLRKGACALEECRAIESHAAIASAAQARYPLPPLTAAAGLPSMSAAAPESSAMPAQYSHNQ